MALLMMDVSGSLGSREWLVGNRQAVPVPVPPAWDSSPCLVKLQSHLLGTGGVYGSSSGFGCLAWRTEVSVAYCTDKCVACMLWIDKYAVNAEKIR